MNKNTSAGMTTATAALTLLFAAAGCKQPSSDAAAAAPNADPVPAPAPMMEEPYVEIDETPLNELYFSVDRLLLDGKTNEANAAFSAALDAPEFAKFKNRVFSTNIRFLLFTRQFDEAQSAYLNALRLSPEIAEPGFDTIYGAYLNEGDNDAALAWARVLATQDIGEHLRLTATGWLIDSLARTGDTDGAVAEITAALGKFPAAGLADKIASTAHDAVAAGNAGFAAKILAAVEASEKKDAPEFATLRKTLPIRIAAAEGAWDKAAAAVTTVIADTPDQPLQQAVSFAIQTARRAKNFAAVEQIASAVVLDERAAAKERTRSLAAREWVGVIFAEDAARKAEYPARLEKLLQLKLPASQVFGIFTRYFYDILDDLEVLKAVVPIADKLYPQLADESSQQVLNSHLLDASFLLDDYDRSLALLNKGFQDRDEDWHKIAIVKVNAHKAHAEKRYDDAVKYFREFMGLLKDEDTADPVTDIVYSRETLLGNNEKRIGDILKEAGNADEAAKAYAAAKAHYETALTAEKISAPTKAYIEEQVRGLE